MNSLTRFVLDHKRLVLGVWLVVTIAAFAAIGPAGSSCRSSSTSPDARASRRTVSSPPSTAPAVTSRRSCPW